MNKKLILGLGSLAAAALPVTAVVACGSEDKKEVKLTPDQKDVKAVAKLFDAYSKNGTATNLTNASTTKASTLTTKTAAADLGFTDPSVSKLNGTTVTFSVDTPKGLLKNTAGDFVNIKNAKVTLPKYFADDTNGTLLIKVKIKKNDAVETTYFSLSGFKKDQDQIDVNEVAGLFVVKGQDGIEKPFETTKTSDLASSLQTKKTAADLGFTDPSVSKLKGGTTVSFKVKEANDALGFLIVEATITKNSITQNVEFIIEGYKKYSIKDAMDATKDFTSSDNSKSRTAKLSPANPDVKSLFLKIQGYNGYGSTTHPVVPGFEITNVKVKHAINVVDISGKNLFSAKDVIYTVTFKDTKANTTQTKDIKVTFA